MKALIFAWFFAAALAACNKYNNPVIYQDLPDLELFRVNDTYYYTAGTMHLSPGATILKSYDLVHWEFVGHSIPELTFGDKYYLNSTELGYVGGVWASSMGYRESNGVFYWYGCIDFERTFIFTATDPEGEWTEHPPIENCYYDVGLLVDDDDTMYLAYGRYNISVVQLASDGLSPVREEQIWEDPEVYLEGARMYHINSSYYIWLTRPADAQYILKAESPWGPYTRHNILDFMPSPIPDSGTPHQGAIVDTPNGDWYYMSFLDAYPAGRVPALAPLTWDEDGIPHVVTDENGGWATAYPKPLIQTSKTVEPTGEFSDTFRGPKLHPEWQWNHNPDNSAWAFGDDGLILSTATVTDNLVRARNTLTHRTIGPKSSATFRLNLGSMQDGDVAGVAITRDESAYIGLQKTGESLSLVAVHDNIMIDSGNGWVPTSNGTVVATAEGIDLGAVSGGEQDIWLRIVADVHATFRTSNNDNPAQLFYSTDGTTFVELGEPYALHNRWQFFVAFRFAVFNYATKALGGSVTVKEFNLELVD